MKHLLNMHLEDDSTLVIGVEGDQLVSQHDGRDPEPLGEGPLYVVWLALRGRQGVPRLRVLFVCDDLGPDVEGVEIDTPYIRGDFMPRLHGSELPFFWSGPQLFRPGEVTARWVTKSGGRRGRRTIRNEWMLLEEWGYIAGKSWDTDDVSARRVYFDTRGGG